MNNSRAVTARRLFRWATLLWTLFVFATEVVPASRSQVRLRGAVWEVTAGALALLWVGLAAWSGSVRLGYRGIGTRAVRRSEAPGAFWMHCAVGAVTGVVLLGIGVAALMRS